MTKTQIVNSMSRTFHTAAFQLKKHAPGILVTAGVVGTVVSAVMACKATLKVSPVIEESKKTLDIIHKGIEEKKIVDGEGNAHEYPEEVGKKDLSVTYIQTGVKIAKIYAPAVALGALSITSILVGHNILHKRSLALAAAYATLDTSFKEYRGRVVDRFGKALDRELRYNIKAQEIEEKVIDKETGEEKTVKKTVEVATINQPSDYARFFDVGNEYWEKDAEYNLTFLKHQERYANDKLKAKGHLFLNEVYDMLGIPRTRAGQVVGWIYDEENPNGDNYVDFGIYDLHNDAKRDFVNGKERTILLDFNVDGNIWELMH